MMQTRDNRCPVCRASLWTPGSGAVARKTCPRCGAELWVIAGSGSPIFFSRRPGESERDFLATLIAPLFGMSAEEAEAILQSADSLDLAELLLEVEDAMKSARH